MIHDLRECEPSGLFYGGRAGQKEGILIDGEPWIAKYPRTTRDLRGKRLPSYTSSPVSEYIGSHIFQSLGIPTHETLLGYRNGKIVCACKDFTYPNGRLFEFKDIKNSLSDDDEGFSNAPSDGESILLGDVLGSLDLISYMLNIEGLEERFWDMFVVDAFLKNPDRNNGNWGFLMTAPFVYELAPVYDLGSSLFSKRRSDVAGERLNDEESLQEDAFFTNISCYRLVDEDGETHAIHPFDYMRESDNPDLKVAIERFINAIDMKKVVDIIDEVPAESYGNVLLSDRMRESHKMLLRKRYEDGFLPLRRKGLV